MSVIEKKVSFEGKDVFVRTVTYHYTGRCVMDGCDHLVLVDAAWVADSGRWAEFLVSGDPSEVEPYPDGLELCLNKSAIVEMFEWPHALPRTTK